MGSASIKHCIAMVEKTALIDQMNLGDVQITILLETQIQKVIDYFDTLICFVFFSKSD